MLYLTQNKKKLPLLKNWLKNDHGFWVHKDQRRNLRGKAYATYKQTLMLNQQQKEILIGSLLGDGFMGCHRNLKNPSCHYCLAQTWYAADYVEQVYQIFKPFEGSPPKINLIGGRAVGPTKAFRSSI